MSLFIVEVSLAQSPFSHLILYINNNLAFLLQNLYIFLVKDSENTDWQKRIKKKNQSVRNSFSAPTLLKRNETFYTCFCNLIFFSLLTIDSSIPTSLNVLLNIVFNECIELHNREQGLQTWWLYALLDIYVIYIYICIYIIFKDLSKCVTEELVQYFLNFEFESFK